MEYIIKDRSHIAIFNFFEDIAAIPHGSGNDKGIADYIEDFAKARGLECYRDAIHNVFVKKPATAGRENDPTVLLQAHTDMVCEQNEGTEHDFLTDPLDLYIDGKYLRARGTTLGADDGIGVAMMLAALDGNFASHPALECLFTVSEETGMDGVNGFGFSLVSAKRMINLDSAEIGAVIAGCAGGVRCNLNFKGTLLPSDKKAVKIILGGLAGGHSGENISDGRANANKLMGRVLLALKEFGYELSSVNGGGKSNAIPRECRAVIATDDADGVISCVDKMAAELKIELSPADGGFFLRADAIDENVGVFDENTGDAAIALLGIAPNGVFEMSKYIKGFVEYSRNLGVIVTDGDELHFTFFARSAIDAQLEASNRELEALAKLVGAEVEYSEAYHGWNYEPVSPLRDKYLAACRELGMSEPVVMSIHAGLECGIIKAQIPDMDIISVGPNELDIHSPDEALDLDSVEQLADIIEKVLA